MAACEVPLVITGNEEFYNLQDAMYTNREVVFDKVGDIKPNSYPIFPNCKTLKFNNCDKNFVFYWLRAVVFPNVETVYMHSHPCEPQIFSRLDTNVKIYVHTKYERYVKRWADGKTNISIDESTIGLP